MERPGDINFKIIIINNFYYCAESQMKALTLKVNLMYEYWSILKFSIIFFILVLKSLQNKMRAKILIIVLYA